MRVYGAANDAAGVSGEVAVLESIFDRLAGSVGEPRLAELDAALGALADLAARAAAGVRGVTTNTTKRGLAAQRRRAARPSA